MIDEPFRQLLECRDEGIMYDNHNDLWGSLKESVQKAFDEVCGYKKNMKCNVNTRWWNSGVNDEIQRKDGAYKESN